MMIASDSPNSAAEETAAPVTGTAPVPSIAINSNSNSNSNSNISSPRGNSGATTTGTTGKSSSGGWREQLAISACGAFGYWVTRAPVSSLGMLSQERIKVPPPPPSPASATATATATSTGGSGLISSRTPAAASVAGSASKGVAASTHSASGATAEDYVHSTALLLHAVQQRVTALSAYADLPSLSFLDSSEALSRLLSPSSSSSSSSSGNSPMAVLTPLDIPRELRFMVVDSVELQMATAAAQGYEPLACLVLRFPELPARYQTAHRRARLRTRIAAYQHYASTANLALFPDYQQRLAVLRLLEYVERDSDTVTLKGRVACEMNTCDELVASEAIFGGVLEPLTPPEAAAVLSALVFQEKTEDEARLTSRMELAREQMEDILLAVKELQDAEGVVVNEDFKPSLNFGIAAVVYEWARGVPFKEIVGMTTIHEGSIVRCITRLDELIKDVRNAARVIGNPSLYRKMVAASLCIKRDIVFAPSLFLT